MKENNTIKYFIFSIILSSIGIVALFKVNIEIANKHLMSSGKTRALFGLIEMSYWNRYFLSILGILSILISSKINNKLLKTTSIITGLLTIIVSFSNIWKLLI